MADEDIEVQVAESLRLLAACEYEQAAKVIEAALQQNEQHGGALDAALALGQAQPPTDEQGFNTFIALVQRALLQGRTSFRLLSAAQTAAGTDAAALYTEAIEVATAERADAIATSTALPPSSSSSSSSPPYFASNPILTPLIFPRPPYLSPLERSFRSLCLAPFGKKGEV
mmetsp:Transcript_6910/g.22192  ORF Transcript_6910/g.22192 Transcript_6910/m.22192 type:complete len:171 (+) Transcript_6910:156-668(+)